MEYVWKKYGVFIDPHTAVAFAAAREINAAQKWNSNAHTIVLATGHPARTADIVEKATGKAIKIPASLRALQKICDPVAIIPPQPDVFQSAVAACL